MKLKNSYIENLKKKDVSFYSFPVKYSLKDYNNVLDNLIKKAKNSKEVLSVYTFGEIGVPGISDLDLIFVLKENSTLPSFLKSIFFGRYSGYILFHPFFIITEEIMKNIRYLYPNSDFKNIYGKNIKIKKLSKQELKKIKTYLTLDVILRHFPVDHLHTLLSKRIHMRMILVRLNSLVHSFGIIKEISGVEKKEWKFFSININYLRKNWFKLDPKKREVKAFNLLKDAVYISMNIIEEYDKLLLKDKKNLMRLDKRNVLFKGIKNRISFISNWDGNKVLDEMISHYIKYKNFYSILPSSFLKQLCCYSSVKGRLSKYIKSKLNIQCFQNKIDPIMKKRINLLNDQVEYANRLKHSHFPCFFPLGYKTERGLKNKLIIIYVIITNNSFYRTIMSNFRQLLR